MLLLADDFDQYALFPAAIELTVKDLFPRPKIQFSIGNSDDHLASHDLPFDVCIRIVFAGVVVPVLAGRCVRYKPLQEVVVVLEQPGLIAATSVALVARSYSQILEDE